MTATIFLFEYELVGSNLLVKFTEKMTKKLRICEQSSPHFTILKRVFTILRVVRIRDVASVFANDTK